MLISMAKSRILSDLQGGLMILASTVYVNIKNRHHVKNEQKNMLRRIQFLYVYCFNKRACMN